MIGAAKSRHDQEGFREPHEAPRNTDDDVRLALALPRIGAFTQFLS
jgi:hypothetical protein